MTDTDRALLDAWATTSGRPAGAREAALTEVTGLSPTRTYLRLRALLDDPEAWAYAPVTLRLIRDQMTRVQAARRVA